jgi:rod shape determining protein RodA
MRSSKVIIFTIAVLIALIGISSIYSSTYQKEGQLWQGTYKKQALWVILGVIVFLFISKMNYLWLWDFTYPLYSLVLLFLLLVFILGAVRLGAQRWLRFAWFNFQPSEFAKLTIVIFLARYFSKKSVNDTAYASEQSGLLRGLIYPFLFVAIPMGLVMEQPDLGSACMILFLFTVMLYLTGTNIRYVLVFLLTIILPLPFFWNILRDYQKERLLVFLNPNMDPLGAGYTIIQSKIAIGSGAIFGKGWLAGTQSQLRFLPESHTDFIFATFTEQWGLLGSLLLIFLYFCLIQQGFQIARRSTEHFGRLLALGVTCMLAIQVVINIAMNLGLAPIVGIPLPLMSYGGSSMITTFIALGILVNIDSRRAAF